MSFKNLAAAAVVLAGVVFTGRMAMAATETGTLTVSATVIATCTIGDGAIAFTGYDPVGVHAAAALDSSTTLSVQCTNGTPYSIGLNAGANPNGAVRRMLRATGTEYLTYELYSDSNRTAVWTDAAPLSGTAASNSAFNVTVYGRVPQAQDVPIGTYNDSVTATINF